MTLQVVSFQQISRILEVTDALGLNREWVEIPLSPEIPGLVRRCKTESWKSSLTPSSPSNNGSAHCRTTSNRSLEHDGQSPLHPGPNQGRTERRAS